MAKKRQATSIDEIIPQLHHQYTYKPSKLRIDSINVLPQPRKTFDGILELAEDIAHKGILNPVTVAAFDDEACRNFIETINQLWRVSYSIDDLCYTIKRKKCTYHVLLAGERRYRALQYLWESGCRTCQETDPLLKPGDCFRRHLGGEQVEVRLCQNIPPLSALFLQLSENTHRRVPRHEEAQAYYQLYRLACQLYPDLTVGRFARLVGRGLETISNALKFCLLPGEIQDAVEQKKIKYGVAIELARLQEAAQLDRDQLFRWMVRALVGRYKVGTFRQIVDQHLKDRMSGQVSLLDLMEEAQRKNLERGQTRLTVAKNSIAAVWNILAYFRLVNRLFKQGLLGPDEAPFSRGSPIRVFRAMLDELTDALKNFSPFLPKSLIPVYDDTLAELLAICDEPTQPTTS